MKDEPFGLVASAKDLLAMADEHTAGLWPRASALLGRQALEMSLERLLGSATLPGPTSG